MTNAYGWTDTKAVFDNHGNMVDRFNLDADGEPAINPLNGYSGYKFDYDSEGVHREHLSYYDENDAPTPHTVRGYYSVRTDLDSVGNQVRTIYLDADGNLVELLDNCIATIERAYDAKNGIVSMRLYNAAGEAIKSCNGDWHETRYYYHENGPLARTERHQKCLVARTGGNGALHRLFDLNEPAAVRSGLWPPTRFADIAPMQ